MKEEDTGVQSSGAHELCESRGGRPGLLLVPSSPFGLCGREATVNY